MNELTFDQDNHLYYLDGLMLPSVTQLMQPLNEAKYATIDPVTLDAAARRGTEVHEAVEFYNNYGIMEIAPQWQGYADAYLLWFQRHNPTVVSAEMKTWHKQLMYAGTVDMLARIDDRLYLIDVKTTATINDMLTTVQLEAYAQALRSHHIEVQNKAILQLKRDGSYEFRPYKALDIPAWRVFTSLITIRSYIDQHKGG